MSATINGVTINDVTRMMRKAENLIAWYNKKYNFDMTGASVKDLKDYESALNNWDFLKSKRDILKSA